MSDSPYTFGEELANSISHGIGLVLALGGSVILVVNGAMHGDAWQITSVCIFGASLILLYGASTLYHSISNVKAKKVLRLIDHISIYLLIAGTYTPIMLVNMRGPWGWSLFGVVWGLATLGIAFQFSHLHRMEKLRPTIFLLMGWAIVIGFKPLMESIAPGGLALIAAGGGAYTLGVLFYAWEKLPYNHAIWHLFVLTGSVCHYFAILFYVQSTGA